MAAAPLREVASAGKIVKIMVVVVGFAFETHTPVGFCGVAGDDEAPQPFYPVNQIKRKPEKLAHLCRMNLLMVDCASAHFARSFREKNTEEIQCPIAAHQRTSHNRRSAVMSGGISHYVAKVISEIQFLASLR